MKTIIFCLLFGAIVSPLSHAAVIMSNCPVATTEKESSSVPIDRFRPSEAHLWLRYYSREFPKVAQYVAWLFSDRSVQPSQLSGVKDAAFKAGQWLEDVQFTSTFFDRKPRCHDKTNPITDAAAIFPFVLKTSSPEKYRIRFKLCGYYVDEQRQLPFEDDCTILGREKGYMLSELDQRFDLLRRNIQKSKDVVDGVAVLAGIASTVAVFKVLRVLRVAGLTGLAISAAPTGAAFYAIHSGLTNDVIRDLIDFKDAAEVPVTGDLSTAIKVSRPIQDFAPYFQRYLESIDHD